MTFRVCADVIWRKSLRSAQGECVEVAENGTEILIRDSKDPSGPVLVCRRDRWTAFLHFVTGR